jgi:FtsP/CotA-like multicopper oxidase with cupredoxin domain
MATTDITIHASIPMPFDIRGGNPLVNNAETFGGTIPGTFDGSLPGSTLILDVGDTLIVRLINDLPYPTAIHWHGIELENYSDGAEVTQNEVVGGPIVNGLVTGGTFLYKFNVPKPGIFWFHPHHHHSTNRVFRGQYGMLIVRDTFAIEAALAPFLPTPANTYRLVLSDITVCKTPGMIGLPGGNDPVTYVNPTTLPLAERAEWLSGLTSQNGPQPADLCELFPLKDDGDNGGTIFISGQIPNTFRTTLTPGVPPTVEGQTVLTNGVNVGPRKGTPLLGPDPGPFPLPEPGYQFITAHPGDGLRFQIANTASTRYFRLILTTAAGVQVNLFKIGGEGGYLNDPVLEGGTLNDGMSPGYNTKYFSGEILLPPGTRADVVAVIPLGTDNTTLTMWTRDFQRTGAGYSRLPTVPVLHINIDNAPVALFPFTLTTPLKSSVAPVSPLPAPTDPLPFLNPLAFGKPGAPNLTITTQDIELTATGTMNGINGVMGMFDNMPYTTNLHIDSTRYAKNGNILQFRVKNLSGAHHPFHLHGFSFHPVTLETNAGTLLYTWPTTATEFRDNFDIPAGHTVTFKVEISARPLADGLTPGGAFGRWHFHCHIFFHAHHGMISELVITDPDGTGSEKPNVNVHGSWAYAPSGGIATRTGTYFHPDGDAIGLTASYGTVNDLGGGNWNWTSPVGAPDQPNTFVYITATEVLLPNRKDQAVFRLKIGGADDGSDNGDPHIHTVDGKRYDFQAAGEFIMLRDRDGLEVQSRQTPVLTANPITDSYTGLKSCVSLNTAVAARVGSHRIALQPGKEQGQFLFFVDGKQSRLTTQGLNLDGHHVSGFDVDGVMALRVDYLQHAVLIATPLLWTTHNLWYLNISVSRTHAEEGLMGPILQNTWLPLLPSGASVGPMPVSLNDRYTTLYKTFADAWRLTDMSSLFVYEQGTSTSTFTDHDWPAGEPPCKLKPQFEIPGWVVPEGMGIEKAKQICQIITDEGLNQDCVFDVATTGDADFAKAYLITQKIRQRSTAVQIVSTEKGVITAIVSPLIGKQPKPKGTVIFYVDNNAAGEPVKLDTDGRAKWKIDGLDKGTYIIRAIYTPADTTVNYPSSSPNLKVTLTESTIRKDHGKNKDGLFHRWYVWVVLVIILILLLLWIIL